MLKKQDPTSLTHIEECAFQTRKSKFKVPFQCLQSAASYLQGELRQANSLLNNVKITSTLSLFFYVLVSRWNQKNIEEKWIEQLESALIPAKRNGFLWFEFQIAGLLAELELSEEKTRKYTQLTKHLGEQTGMESIFSLVKVTERWEHSLDLLSSMGLEEHSSRSSRGKKSRVAWFVDFDRKEIQPKLQVIGNDGMWSKGRNISLKKISILSPSSCEATSIKYLELKLISKSCSKFTLKLS